MRIEGIHKCNSVFQDCDHIYSWMALVAQHINTPIYDVEKIDSDKQRGKIVETTDEKYIVSIICPKCNQDNLIEYDR